MEEQETKPDRSGSKTKVDPTAGNKNTCSRTPLPVQQGNDSEHGKSENAIDDKTNKRKV